MHDLHGAANKSLILFANSAHFNAILSEMASEISRGKGSMANFSGGKGSMANFSGVVWGLVGKNT